MKKILIISLLAAIFMSCAKQPEAAQPTVEYPVRGADFGWLSEMEHDSVPFYDSEKRPTDCIRLYQDAGMNAVRLRVWVNHSTGWSNLPDVLAMAKRVQQAGLPLMIDLHYSDFFADPAKQNIPEAWQQLNHEQLCEAVANHTREVLRALQEEGVYPVWIQIGNETTYGTLWPDGQLSKEDVDREAYLPKERITRDIRLDWRAYAELSNAGYDAAKEIMPEIICIVHVDNAFIPRVNWFNRFRAEGGKWDMIGLSHYPFTQDTLSWKAMNDCCKANVVALYEEFQTPVMMVEIGVKTEEMPSEAADCMRDYMTQMEGVEGYTGVFYWEPEVYGGWRPAEYIPLGWGSYNMGCMTPEGQLSEAAHILYGSK